MQNSLFKRAQQSIQKFHEAEQRESLSDRDMRQNMVDLMDSLLPVFEDFVRLEFKAATASDSEPLILLKDATAMDIKRRIASLIHAKRDKINRSNQLEFIDQANSKNDCARTDAAIIDRSIQMKQAIAFNESGPLQRSTKKDDAGSTTIISGSSSPLPPSIATASDSLHIKSGTEVRINTIGDHIGVHFKNPERMSIDERIKFLEKRIMDIERDYPTFASFHFSRADDQTPALSHIVRRHETGEIRSALNISAKTK